MYKYLMETRTRRYVEIGKYTNKGYQVIDQTW